MDSRTRVILALAAICSFICAGATGRAWSNYLQVSHAVIALICAFVLRDIFYRLRFSGKEKRALLVVCLVFLGVSFTQVGTFISRRVRSTDLAVGGIAYPKKTTRALLVNIIRGRTDPWDSILITGYAPEIYVLSERKPASRHLISNLVENFYPGSGVITSINEEMMVELLADLERTKPRVIIDANALKFQKATRSVLIDELKKRYMKENYSTMGLMPGVYFSKLPRELPENIDEY